MRSIVSADRLAAGDAVNAAVVTIYVPDTSPVAMSADVLGTDGAGRTTWRLSPGQPSGTLSVVDFPVGTQSQCIRQVCACATDILIGFVQ